MESIETNLSIADARLKSSTMLRYELAMAEEREAAEAKAAKEKGKIPSKEQRIEEATMAVAASKEIIAVSSESGMRPYRKIVNSDGEVMGWEPIGTQTLNELVWKIMRCGRMDNSLKYHLPRTPNNVKMIAEGALYETAIPVSERRKSDGLFMVSSEDEGLYFSDGRADGGSGGILTLSEIGSGVDNHGCFRRFFDSESGRFDTHLSDDEIVVVREWADRAHKEGLEWLKGKGKEDCYNVRFGDTFYLWADKRKDVYMDILTIACMPLVKRKADKAFFISGPKHNGKSSFRELLMRVYGDRNCGSVQMSQLGDRDFAGELEDIVLNFPDEENTSVEGGRGFDKAQFKSMATHDNIRVGKKYSSVPFNIKCDFVSITPLNEPLKWDNIDGGVASRIMVIPFDHDFREQRERGVGGGSSWGEDKYTREFCLEVLGELMGLAWAYNEWGEGEGRASGMWFWSQRSLSISNEWSDTNGLDQFFKEFEAGFTGFESWELLWRAYKGWCDAKVKDGEEYSYASMAELKYMGNHLGYSREHRKTDAWTGPVDLSCGGIAHTRAKVMLRENQKVIKGRSLSRSNVIETEDRRHFPISNWLPENGSVAGDVVGMRLAEIARSDREAYNTAMSLFDEEGDEDGE